MVIEAISSFIKANYPLKEIGTPEFRSDIEAEFSLIYIGCGISRVVFKEHCSRKVIKIGVAPRHNRCEYAIYKAFDGTQLQSLLAKCFDISSDGMVMYQEFLRKGIFDYALAGTMELSGEWAEFQFRLESLFSFIKNFTKDKYTICDMHCDNIRVDSKHNLKIIDYATPLDTISRSKNFDLEACIRKLSGYAKRNDQKAKFYMNTSRQLVLDVGSELFKMPSTKHLTA